MASYNDHRHRNYEQSSQSDISPQKNTDKNPFKITSNPQHPKRNIKQHAYDESSESDISSLSEDSDEEREQQPVVRVPHNKKTIQIDYDSSEESQDSSGVDLIEQRIKRLQVDLEAKIDRHVKFRQPNLKQPSTQSHFKEEELASRLKKSALSNPPLPPARFIQPAPLPQRQVIPPAVHYQVSQNRNQLNYEQKHVPLYSKQSMHSSKHQEVHHSHLLVEPPKKSPKRKQSKKELPGKTSSITLEKAKGSTKPRAKTDNNNAVALLHKAHKQIDELHKTIQELRYFSIEIDRKNNGLKEQMGKSKKKHSSQQVQKLNRLPSGDLKLQKQIETLKAIEQIQVKLKKSIAKKMKSKNPNMQPQNLQ